MKIAVEQLGKGKCLLLRHRYLLWWKTCF